MGYIGYTTKSIKERFSQHKYEALNKKIAKTPVKYIINRIIKYVQLNNIIKNFII